MIREESNTSWQEMYKVFNMGHRMEFYVEEKYADDIINISKSFKVDAKIIGRVESGKGKKLTIRNKQEIFTY
jgi:phosphoribosylformylglycinamidine cyclo-ligase